MPKKPASPTSPAPSGCAWLDGLKDAIEQCRAAEQLAIQRGHRGRYVAASWAPIWLAILDLARKLSARPMPGKYAGSVRFLEMAIEAVERAFANAAEGRDEFMAELAKVDDPGHRVETILGGIQGWLEIVSKPPPRLESPRELASLPHMSAEQIVKMTGICLEDARRLFDDPAFNPPRAFQAAEPAPVKTLDKALATRLMALLSTAQEAEADSAALKAERDARRAEEIAAEQENNDRMLAAFGGVVATE